MRVVGNEIKDALSRALLLEEKCGGDYSLLSEEDLDALNKEVDRIAEKNQSLERLLAAMRDGTDN